MVVIRMMWLVLRRPFQFFEQVQEPGRIRWHQSVLMVMLAFASKMASIVVTGYAFQTREPYEISAFFEFVWLVVPWITWCVANWAVSTILDGEGKFAEIVHGSAFSLVPYIVFIISVTLLTRVLALDESGTYTFLMFATYAWVAWLLLIKIKVLHDFEFGKLILIVFLTLVGVGILWFVCVLMFGLINQFANFVMEIVKEIRLRS